MRLASGWVTATADAVSMPSTASPSSTEASDSSPNAKSAPRTVYTKRISTYTATLVEVAAISAVTAEGAYAYAFGSHRCSGNSAIFRHRPATMNATAVCTVRVSATAGRRSARSAMFRVPVIA